MQGRFKMCNTCIIRLLARKNERKGEEIFELIMAQKFAKLMTENKLDIHEAQRTTE